MPRGPDDAADEEKAWPPTLRRRCMRKMDATMMAPTMTMMMVKMAQPLSPLEWCSAGAVGLGDAVLLVRAS